MRGPSSRGWSAYAHRVGKPGISARRYETKNRPQVCDRFGASKGTKRYFADFVAVRRQRVQTSAFTAVPLRVIV